MARYPVLPLAHFQSLNDSLARLAADFRSMTGVVIPIISGKAYCDSGYGESKSGYDRYDQVVVMRNACFQDIFEKYDRLNFFGPKNGGDLREMRGVAVILQAFFAGR